jgi:gamma-aminobutyric acid receptor subunit beta
VNKVSRSIYEKRSLPALALLPLLLLLINNALFAQTLESGAYELVGDRPDSTGDATLITVNLYLIDIDSIDDVKQRFGVDLFLNISWQDPRLALSGGLRTGRNRTLPLAEVWSPRGLIVNDRGLSEQLPQVINVDDDGGIEYRQRLIGELAVDMDLREFPFDTQRLPIDIISYQYSPDQVRFALPTALGIEGRRLSAGGWDFKMLEPKVSEFKISAAGIVRPQLTFAIEARRNGSYYVLTTILPITLILFMSWMAFWLQPDIIPTRIGISTASIFSLVAFGVSIRLSLPAVSYMTRTDIFVIGSMLMVFLALSVAVIGSRWANSDRMPQALRLNAVARWAYVVLFVVVATIALS